MSVYLSEWSELSKKRQQDINCLINSVTASKKSLIAFSSLYVTGKCHLSCPHCYAQEEFGMPDDGSLEHMVQIMVKLRPFSDRIQFTGGEPMVRRDSISKKNDVLLLCDVAKQLGYDIILQTTGMQLKPWMLSILKKRNVTWISLSLDGPTAEDNSVIRGTDTAFAKVIDLIPLLKEHGFKIKVGSSITSVTKSIEKVRKTGELLQALGVDVWKLTQFFGRDMGRASSKSKGILDVSNEDFELVIDVVKNEFLGKFSKLAFQRVVDFENSPAFLIAPTGDITVTIGQKDVLIGNLLKDSEKFIVDNVEKYCISNYILSNEDRSYKVG